MRVNLLISLDVSDIEKEKVKVNAREKGKVWKANLIYTKGTFCCCSHLLLSCFEFSFRQKGKEGREESKQEENRKEEDADLSTSRFCFSSLPTD